MSRVESPEELRDAVVQRAGDAAQRVAEVADNAGAQVASRVHRAAGRSGILGLKAGSRVGAAGTRIGAKGSRLGASGLLFGAKAGVREKLRPARDAKLKGQLDRTSRQLAEEASDLAELVDSLNAVIQANRRAVAAGRTRLFLGAVIGALAAYHLDRERGAQRRAVTGERIRQLLRSQTGIANP